MKKLLSGILAAAVACSSALCLTTAASAAEDNGYALSVAFDKTEVGKGEDLTMTIKLDENPGLVSIRFQVKYNPEAVIIEKTADITSLEDFGTPGSFTTPKANNETGTVTLRWSCPLSEQNITVTGDIATVKFTVNSDSPVGSTGISIEPIEINMIDEETLDFIDLDEKYGTDVTGYFKTPSEADVDKMVKIACAHTWDEGTVTKEPTCTAKGVRTFTCTECGETKTEEIDALGHNWNAGEITTDPTCTEKGVKTFTCTRCSVTKTEEVEALGHTWDEGTVTTEPTCTEKGVKTFTCTRCNLTKTEEVEALGHTWDEGAVTTEPTCTEDGVKTFTCTRCGETKTEDVPALGHDWGEWTVSKEATSEEEGEETRECNRCGEKETRTIEKLPPEVTTTTFNGHFYVPETTTTSSTPAESEVVTTAQTTAAPVNDQTSDAATTTTTTTTTAAPVDNTPTDTDSNDDNTGTYETTVADNTLNDVGNANNSNTGGKNQPTGVVLAVIPAVAAAAGVVIFKKRK